MADREGKASDGIAEIVDAGLVFNQTLVTLDLRTNCMAGVEDHGRGTYQSSGLRALADALAFNTVLKELVLDNNKLAGCEYTTWAEHPKALQESYHVFREALGDALKKNSSLTVLSMQKCLIGPKGAVALAEGLQHAVSLQTLDLSGNVLCGAYRNENEFVPGSYDPSGVQALAKVVGEGAPALETLLLGSNHIGGDEYEEVESEEDDDYFAFSDVPDGFAALAEALQRNTHLTHLDLSRNNGGPKVAYGGVKEGSEIVVGAGCSGGVKEGSGIVGFTAIAKGIASSSSLRHLDLRHNAPSPAAIETLERAVVEHPHLWENFNGIPMSQLRRSSEESDMPVARYMSNASGISELSAELADLNLKGAGIGAVGAVVLARCLVMSPTLSTLTLAENSIGLAGARALARALVPDSAGNFNGSLDTITLDSVPLPVGALRRNELTSLDLSEK
eukprot:gene9147-10840_t